MEVKRKTSKDLLTGLNIADLLLTWYHKEKRDLPWRETKDPYAIWVSEVMLQQTQVKTVIPYFERFLQRFPSLKELGKASFEDVLTEWRGLGYYSRARRMWEGAHYLLTQRAGEMPDNYDELLQVPGIGKYTAGAVASIAFGQKVSAIDGNVLRVMSRLLAWPEPVESVRSYRYFDKIIAVWQPISQPGDFNQGLMELGATICTPSKPNCGGCPLIKVCLGNKQGDVLHYPVKKPKPQRQEVTRLTFVLRYEDEVYLQKRPSDGLLANLWELPGVEFLQGNSQSDCLPTLSQSYWFQLFQDAVSDRSFDRTVQEQIAQGFTLQGPVWYNFSHRRWKILWVIFDMSKILSNQKNSACNAGLVKEVGENYLEKGKIEHLLKESRCWVSLNDLGGIPLPVAFREVLDKLMKANIY